MRRPVLSKVNSLFSISRFSYSGTLFCKNCKITATRPSEPSEKTAKELLKEQERTHEHTYRYSHFKAFC